MVMAYKVMAYIAIAYIVMAYVVMAFGGSYSQLMGMFSINGYFALKSSHAELVSLRRRVRTHVPVSLRTHVRIHACARIHARVCYAQIRTTSVSRLALCSYVPM